MDYQKIIHAINQYQKKLCQLSDEIWHKPELKFEEHFASELLANFLESEGFEIVKPLADLPTAFSASFSSNVSENSPTIGILGEYDALPTMSQKANIARPDAIEENGPGHGCGHNMLGVGAVAAALATRDFLKETNTPGTVVFFGCPAEEGGGGKVVMKKNGAFDAIDAAITWHPSNQFAAKTANTLATTTNDFRFSGRSSHAAKSPHLGRSAVDAVELMNVGVNYLREHVSSDVRMHYAWVETGGSAPNVVQSHATIRYQIRAAEAATMQDVYKRVQKIAEGACLMTETSVEIIPGTTYLNLIPSLTISRKMHQHAEAMGAPVYTEEELAFSREILTETVGAEKAEKLASPVATQIDPYTEAPAIHSASTDVGDVSWLVPTVEYRSATWVHGTEGHTWPVVAQGLSVTAHKGMLHAGMVMAATAIDLFQDPETVTAAKTELHNRIHS